MDKIKKSKIISDFLLLLDECVKSEQYYIEELTELDKYTQDLLHHLELDKINTSEKNKIATKLKKCRQQRRIAKDKKEELELIVNFYNNNNKKSMDKLKYCLGDIKKIENYHNKRSYVPKSKYSYQ